VTTFVPADRHEWHALTDYLTRLVALDARACVRLQAHGQVLGVWGGPPLDAVTLRPVALAEPSDLSDATVSAVRLLERLDPVAGSTAVEVPPAVPGPPWAGLLPPRTGWQPAATMPAGAVHDAVRVAVDGFRRRLDLIPEHDRSRARLDALAAEVWDRPLVAAVPLRVAHAAELTGLLGREGEVTALRQGDWSRLQCPGGSVAARAGAGPALELFALSPS
jgi:hypothetical protein